MKANARQARRGRTSFGLYGIIIVLATGLAMPALGHDAKPQARVFTLAAEGGTVPALVVLPAGAPVPAGKDPGPVYREESARPPRPPVKAGKVAAQILAGVGVTGGMFALSILTASESTIDDDEAMRKRAAVWQLVGGAALTPWVVYLIGNAGPQTGSLGRTYLYGVVGGAAGALLLLLAFEADNDALGIGVFAVTTVVPAIASIIGYNTSRRYDEPAPVRTALLGLEGGKLRFGVPVPSLVFSGGPKKSPGVAIRIFEAGL